MDIKYSVQKTDFGDLQTALEQRKVVLHCSKNVQVEMAVRDWMQKQEKGYRTAYTATAAILSTIQILSYNDLLLYITYSMEQSPS